jgi:hypothetical protein
MGGHESPGTLASRPLSQPSLLASAAEKLIAHLGLSRRTTAEVQDLYSRPITAPAVPLRGSKRLCRPVSVDPERNAA